MPTRAELERMIDGYVESLLYDYSGSALKRQGFSSLVTLLGPGDIDSKALRAIRQYVTAFGKERAGLIESAEGYDMPRGASEDFFHEFRSGGGRARDRWLVAGHALYYAPFGESVLGMFDDWKPTEIGMELLRAASDVGLDFQRKEDRLYLRRWE